jgi:hypothetical protein
MKTNQLYTPPQAIDLSGLIASGGRPKPLALCQTGGTVKASNTCPNGSAPMGRAGDCKVGKNAAFTSGTCVSNGGTPLLKDSCSTGTHLG